MMRGRNLTFELALTAILAMAAVLAATAWLSMHWYRSWLMSEAERGVELASEMLRISLREGMLHNQQDQITETVGRIGRDDRIESIRVSNHRGEVRLATDSEDLGELLEIDLTELTNREGETLTTANDGVLRALTPVPAEPACLGSCHQDVGASGILGVIDVDYSLRGVEQAISESRFRILSLFLVAIGLVSGSVWLVLNWRLKKPVRDLVQGMERVADGDLKHPVPVHSRNELGELAESFNDMSLRISTLQEGLIRSERLISMGKLAAGVAHEINNPLTGILSYAEDLVEDTEPSDPRRKDYEVILHEAIRCRQIVRGLLDFARQETPSLVRSGPVEMIDKALDVVARQAAFQEITIEKDIEEDLPTIEVDPVQIQQVLVNLVVNAQQAMPEGGTIVLGARSISEPSRIEFTVEDEGTGIPPDIQSRMFEPFFSTKEGETDGLGLAVCQGIVEQHGGVIEVASKVGVGTRFRVVLPLSGEQVDKEVSHDG
jgi:two-component system NtrC family sensor kinase